MFERAIDSLQDSYYYLVTWGHKYIESEEEQDKEIKELEKAIEILRNYNLDEKKGE